MPTAASFRVDLYTKVILTVIAGALVWLCLKDTPANFANAQAAQPAQPVAIVGGQLGGTSPVMVRIVGVEQGSWKDTGGKTVYEAWNRLPVKN